MALTKQELEECRNFKRKLDMAQTPQGQIAVKMAQAKRRERENRENILRQYTEPAAPPDLSERKAPISPILKQYIDGRFIKE